MMKKFTKVAATLLVIAGTTVFGEDNSMSGDRLETLIREVSDDKVTVGGNWIESLNSDDVLSAIYQVYSLRVSFGTEYSSGLLTFGGDDSMDEEAI